MKHLRWIILVVLAAACLLAPINAYAQSYLFALRQLNADVFVNADGTAAIEYLFIFDNAPGAHAIDFVDVGMPSYDYSLDGAFAEVDGQAVQLSKSEYAGDGSGFAVVLGREAIGSGKTGSVHVYVPKVESWLRTDSQGDQYASFVFSPTWFGSEYVQGSTNTTVTIHFPPGVQPNEPRWHAAPAGFPDEPATGIDDQGRPYYRWNNPNAKGYSQYKFGVSFPATYVPESAIKNPSLWEALGINAEDVFGFACCGGIGLIFLAIFYGAAKSAKNRKLQYMPPKVAIEGLGIKRGLTAVEAAILMVEPLDKVMTMILFGLVKKNAATVTSKTPMEIKAADPLPEGLYDYEKDFLKAFQKPKSERRKALQDMTVDLIKGVTTKMKGFSSKETIAYYKDIMEKAWRQVEAGQTPEVKSAEFDKYMEWTMLDKDYDDRTRRVFSGPVYIPTWWPRYDPTYRPTVVGGQGTSIPASTGGGRVGSGGGVNVPSPAMPTLPGANFAASVIGGVQNFAGGIVGDLESFTNSITNKTNPPPPPSTSSYRGGGGGGHSCACACACAGCACACAGGGR